MSDARPEIPNFGELLQPYLGQVPPRALPGTLARLERGAANRYREWAKSFEGADAKGLLECAAREDEIADRVQRLFPVAPEDADKVEAAVPAAIDAYYAAFGQLPVREQLRIQAGAERQGAAAWRGLASGSDDAAVRRELETCSELEIASAEHLERFLGIEPGA